MNVLVTGGASGIGAAIVERFESEGATGLVLDLAESTVWPTKRVDVTEDSSLQEALADERFDVVVAAAGIVPPWSPIAELDLEQWDNVFAVNARGVVATLKHAQVEVGGAIVVVASLNAFKGDPNLAAYVASKHAALGIVRAAALDLGRRGIRVNAVAPGPIATEALRQRMRRREQDGGPSVADALANAGEGTALGRIATVEEVADAVHFLAGATGITGQLLPVDGGIA
jgi:NAD(P)-dependent dehydrogenase (short-subunit alcohol dehydrogenase family)